MGSFLHRAAISCRKTPQGRLDGNHHFRCRCASRRRPSVTGHLTVCTLMERWLPVSAAADGTDGAAMSEVGDVGTQSAALNRE